MTGRTRALAAVALAAVAVTVLMLASGVGRGGVGPGHDAGLEAALARLAALREAVAECNAGIAAEQARFDAHQARLDSLRAVVDGYESPERTVPADRFQAYLEAFDAHNRAVADWDGRAEALEASWAACRELTERHNALVDSLAPAPRHRSPVRPVAPG